MTVKKTTLYRSAKSGEFITRAFAERHPSTTVKERIVVPKPSATKPRRGK
ncbi:hypothetical protein AB4Y64_01550 [Lysobacter sp. TAF61]